MSMGSGHIEGNTIKEAKRYTNTISKDKWVLPGCRNFWIQELTKFESVTIFYFVQSTAPATDAISASTSSIALQPTLSNTNHSELSSSKVRTCTYVASLHLCQQYDAQQNTELSTTPHIRRLLYS